MVKVVVERQIGEFGSCDAASYRTCCISTAIARTGRISQTYFSSCCEALSQESRRHMAPTAIISHEGVIIPSYEMQ